MSGLVLPRSKQKDDDDGEEREDEDDEVPFIDHPIHGDTMLEHWKEGASSKSKCRLCRKLLSMYLNGEKEPPPPESFHHKGCPNKQRSLQEAYDKSGCERCFEELHERGTGKGMFHKNGCPNSVATKQAVMKRYHKKNGTSTTSGEAKHSPNEADGATSDVAMNQNTEDGAIVSSQKRSRRNSGASSTNQGVGTRQRGSSGRRSSGERKGRVGRPRKRSNSTTGSIDSSSVRGGRQSRAPPQDRPSSSRLSKRQRRRSSNRLDEDDNSSANDSPSEEEEEEDDDDVPSDDENDDEEEEEDDGDSISGEEDEGDSPSSSDMNEPDEDEDEDGDSISSKEEQDLSRNKRKNKRGTSNSTATTKKQQEQDVKPTTTNAKPTAAKKTGMGKNKKQLKKALHKPSSAQPSPSPLEAASAASTNDMKTPSAVPILSAAQLPAERGPHIMAQLQRPLAAAAIPILTREELQKGVDQKCSKCRNLLNGQPPSSRNKTHGRQCPHRWVEMRAGRDAGCYKCARDLGDDTVPSHGQRSDVHSKRCPNSMFAGASPETAHMIEQSLHNQHTKPPPTKEPRTSSPAETTGGKGRRTSASSSGVGRGRPRAGGSRRRTGTSRRSSSGRRSSTRTRRSSQDNDDDNDDDETMNDDEEEEDEDNAEEGDDEKEGMDEDRQEGSDKEDDQEDMAAVTSSTAFGRPLTDEEIPLWKEGTEFGCTKCTRELRKGVRSKLPHKFGCPGRLLDLKKGRDAKCRKCTREYDLSQTDNDATLPQIQKHDPDCPNSYFHQRKQMLNDRRSSGGGTGAERSSSQPVTMTRESSSSSRHHGPSSRSVLESVVPAPQLSSPSLPTVSTRRGGNKDARASASSKRGIAAAIGATSPMTAEGMDSNRWMSIPETGGMPTLYEPELFADDTVRCIKVVTPTPESQVGQLHSKVAQHGSSSKAMTKLTSRELLPPSGFLSELTMDQDDGTTTTTTKSIKDNLEMEVDFMAHMVQYKFVSSSSSTEKDHQGTKQTSSRYDAANDAQQFCFQMLKEFRQRANTVITKRKKLDQEKEEQSKESLKQFISSSSSSGSALTTSAKATSAATDTSGMTGMTGPSTATTSTNLLLATSTTTVVKPKVPRHHLPDELDMEYMSLCQCVSGMWSLLAALLEHTSSTTTSYSKAMEDESSTCPSLLLSFFFQTDDQQTNDVGGSFVNVGTDEFVMSQLCSSLQEYHRRRRRSRSSSGGGGSGTTGSEDDDGSGSSPIVRYSPVDMQSPPRMMTSPPLSGGGRMKKPDYIKKSQKMLVEIDNRTPERRLSKPLPLRLAENTTTNSEAVVGAAKQHSEPALSTTASASATAPTTIAAKPRTSLDALVLSSTSNHLASEASIVLEHAATMCPHAKFVAGTWITWARYIENLPYRNRNRNKKSNRRSDGSHKDDDDSEDDDDDDDNESNENDDAITTPSTKDCLQDALKVISKGIQVVGMEDDEESDEHGHHDASVRDGRYCYETWAKEFTEMLQHEKERLEGHLRDVLKEEEEEEQSRRKSNKDDDDDDDDSNYEDDNDSEKATKPHSKKEKQSVKHTQQGDGKYSSTGVYAGSDQFWVIGEGARATTTTAKTTTTSSLGTGDKQGAAVMTVGSEMKIPSLSTKATAAAAIPTTSTPLYVSTTQIANPLFPLSTFELKGKSHYDIYLYSTLKGETEPFMNIPESPAPPLSCDADVESSTQYLISLYGCFRPIPVFGSFVPNPTYESGQTLVIPPEEIFQMDGPQTRTSGETCVVMDKLFIGCRFCGHIPKTGMNANSMEHATKLFSSHIRLECPEIPTSVKKQIIQYQNLKSRARHRELFYGDMKVRIQNYLVESSGGNLVPSSSPPVISEHETGATTAVAKAESTKKEEARDEGGKTSDMAEDEKTKNDGPSSSPDESPLPNTTDAVMTEASPTAPAPPKEEADSTDSKKEETTVTSPRLAL